MAISGNLEFTKIDVMRGWNPSCLQYVAQPAAGVTLVAGHVVHVDDNGKFALGIGTTNKMPLIVLETPATSGSGTLGTDVGAWVAGLPAGTATALPCTGGFEVATPVYDTDGTYGYNTPLTALTSTATAGKLVNTTLGAATICGIVSAPVAKATPLGPNVLRFWTVLLPKYA